MVATESEYTWTPLYDILCEELPQTMALFIYSTTTYVKLRLVADYVNVPLIIYILSLLGSLSIYINIYSLNFLFLNLTVYRLLASNYID